MTSATTILCEFLCKNCHKSIALPQRTLLREFEHRDTQPTGIPSVALVCNHCKIVEIYSEADLQESQVGETGLGWVAVQELPCVEGTCQFHPPVFADWSEATRPEKREVHIRTWRWRPMACEAGHDIPKPQEIYGYPL